MRPKNGKPSKEIARRPEEQGPKADNVLTKRPPESTSGGSARTVGRLDKIEAARKKYLRVHRNGSGRS